MRASSDTPSFTPVTVTNSNPYTVSEQKQLGDEFARVEVAPSTGPSGTVGSDPTGDIVNHNGSNNAVINDWIPARAPNGATYWYSRTTRETTWTDPQSLSGGGRRDNPGMVEAKEARLSCVPSTSAPLIGTIQDLAAKTVAVKVEALPDSAPPSVGEVLMSSAHQPVSGSPLARRVGSAPMSIPSMSLKHETELTPAPTTQPESGSTKNALTTAWRAVRTADGRVYYHDRVSNRTQWEKPADFQQDDKPFPGANEPPNAKSTVQSVVSAKPNGAPVLAKSQILTSTETDVDGGREAGSVNTTNPAEPSSTPLALQDGWSQYRTPDDRAYYYNGRTGETRWDPPTSSGQDASLANVSTAAPANSVSTSALPSAPNLKRSAPGYLPDAQGNMDIWISHLTPQGRQYYYNPRTQATSWSLPPGATIAPSPPLTSNAFSATQLPDDVQSPRNKRARVESPTTTTGHAKRKAGPARRPRDADDNPMTDRAAEAYFLKRAEILRTSPTSEGHDVIMQEDTKGGVKPVSVPGTLAENTQAFYSMLEEAGVTSETPWLDVMARCAGDVRYINLKKYGLRKDAWHKYQAKYDHLSRRAAILDSRERAARFLRCLEEHVVDVDDRVLTLHRCPPHVVQDVEDDPRFREISEPTRASLINVFFARRARISAALRARRRKDILAGMAEALEQRIDPALKAAARENDVKMWSKGAIGANDNEVSKSEPDEKSHERIGTEARDSSKMACDVNANESAENGHDKILNFQGLIFTERTAFRELDQFLQSIDGYGDVSSEDVSDVIRRWQRHVDMLCEERAARERDRRKAKLRENRAEFRHGVLNLVLRGKLPFTARWKEVSNVISKEDFARPEIELGSRPADLFEDGLRLFEERVQKRRDEFKRIIKENGVEVSNQTTLDSLLTFPALKLFLDDVEKSVAQALLVDRQRKENKRRMKEREKLASEFRQVVISSDLPAESTFEDCVEQWKDLPVCKQLANLGAHDTMRRVFDEHLRLRRSKDDRDRRLKRKLDLDEMSTGTSLGIPSGNFHTMPNMSVAPGMSGMSRSSGINGPSGVPDVGIDQTAPQSSRFASHDRIKRLRVSGIGAIDGPSFPGAMSRDEETGWAAVVSEKQLTDEQKAADRERLKQEILKSLESGKSTTNSQV